MQSLSAPMPKTRRLRSIIAGSVGNLIEWYDWYVYSAFALYFAKSFFPEGDLTAQLLNTAAVFAIGFLARPLGGWFMGAYADRHGRRAALLLSVRLMCIGSLIIALAPSFERIGILAPLLLVLARIMQGLSIGGEYGASATYLSEVAGEEHRGFYSSFQYVTIIAGQLLALTLLIVMQQFILTPHQLESFGWRLPFLIGASGALIAMYLRRSMDETPSFEMAKKTVKRQNPIKALLEHPRAVCTVVGLTIGGTVAFYTYTIYMQKFLANTAGMSKELATLVSGAALFLVAFLQPAVGALSDRIGRRPVLISFGVCGTIFTVPLLDAISHTNDPTIAFLLILFALVIVSGYTSISAVVKAELFPTEVRALGVSLPYALTVSTFGGTAEYIALWLKKIGKEPWFYWYVTACILCSLFFYIFTPDTKRHSKIRED